MSHQLGCHTDAIVPMSFDPVSYAGSLDYLSGQAKMYWDGNLLDTRTITGTTAGLVSDDVTIGGVRIHSSFKGSNVFVQLLFSVHPHLFFKFCLFRKAVSELFVFLFFVFEFIFFLCCLLFFVAFVLRYAEIDFKINWCSLKNKQQIEFSLKHLDSQEDSRW